MTPDAEKLMAFCASAPGWEELTLGEVAQHLDMTARRVGAAIDELQMLGFHPVNWGP
jgi:hypothetical protein